MAKERNNKKNFVEVSENSESKLTKDTFMTDEQIAQKYGYDIHTWEGTVSIWKKKTELGIK
jgi:hypothetical protein